MKKFSLAEEQMAKEKGALRQCQRIYEGKLINLRIETIVIDGKKPFHREYVEHKGAVAIVALNEKEQFLLVRQYRQPADAILWEIPAGLLEKGEDPQDCAQRELQEETGYSARRLISLGGFYVSPGFCDEYLHIFLARELTKAPLPCDEEEAIDASALSQKEFFSLLQENKIKDAKTIAGIFLYLQWKEKNS